MLWFVLKPNWFGQVDQDKPIIYDYISRFQQLYLPHWPAQLVDSMLSLDMIRSVFDLITGTSALEIMVSGRKPWVKKLDIHWLRRSANEQERSA